MGLLAKYLFDYLSSSRSADTTDRITNSQNISVLFAHVTEVQKELQLQRHETDLRAQQIDELQERVRDLQQKLILSEIQIKSLETREATLEKERDQLLTRVKNLEAQLGGTP